MLAIQQYRMSIAKSTSELSLQTRLDQRERSFMVATVEPLRCTSLEFRAWKSGALKAGAACSF
jgi:hypothetical protein